MKSKQTVKVVVTIAASTLAILHLLFPKINIDLITVSLLALAIIPWVETLFKSVELPGGLKLEFQELRKLEEEAQKVGLISSEDVKKEPGEEEAGKRLFVELAEQNQELALVSLRLDIEKCLRSIALKYDLKPQKLGINNLLRELASHHIIPIEEESVLRDMIGVLNQASHGVEYDQRTAKWIIEVGPKIIESLESKVERRGGNFSHSNPEAKEHWIDKSFQECEWVTNVEWGECINKHRDLWEKELNNVFNTLLRKLDPSKKAMLEDSQKHWESQLEIDRNLVFSFDDLQFKVGREGMFIASISFMNRIRQRALELEEILTALV